MVAVSACPSGPAIPPACSPCSPSRSASGSSTVGTNCGGPYVWIARAVNPYVGFLAAWAIFGFVLASVSNFWARPCSPWSASPCPGSSATCSPPPCSGWGSPSSPPWASGPPPRSNWPSPPSSTPPPVQRHRLLGRLCRAPAGHRPSQPGLAPSGRRGGKGSIAGAMPAAIFLFTGWDASTTSARSPSEAHQPRPGPAHLGGPVGPRLRLAVRVVPGVVPAAAGPRRGCPALHRPGAGGLRLGHSWRWRSCSRSSAPPRR